MMHLLFLTATIIKIVSAFSWMLIHSLWQGLLLGIICGLLLLLNKRASAVYRYNLALVLFSVFGMVCAATFIWEWNASSAPAIGEPLPGAIGVDVSVSFFNDLSFVWHALKFFGDYFTVNAPLVVLCWFVMFAFKSIKLTGAMVYTQRMRNTHIYKPAQHWEDKITTLCEKLQITKSVKLLGSGYIKVPVVTGHLKPVILMPIGLLAGLPAAQVEAILLHELAHIRRNDYFVNFLQNVSETVFFFNPGLLWISALLREERENCCDDIALAQTNDKRGFIEALISFKENELYGSTYATAFPGKKNQLLRRVSRIMNNNQKNLGMSEKMFLIGVFMMGVLATSVTVAQVSAPVQSQQAQVPAGTITVKPQKVVKTFVDTIRKNKVKGKTVVTRIKKGGVRTVIVSEKDVSPEELKKLQAEAEVRQAEAKVREKEAMTRQAEAEVRQKEAIKRQAEAEVRQKEAMTRQAEAEVRQKEAIKRQAEAEVRQREAEVRQKEAAKRQVEAVKRQTEAIIREKVAEAKQTEANKVQQEEKN